MLKQAITKQNSGFKLKDGKSKFDKIKNYVKYF